MLYNTGTIAINGNTATGTGTNWTAPVSQVRAGQTIIVMSNPVQLFQISSVNSATSLTVTPAASPALNGQKYGILVSDIISVDGLAQAMSQLINEYDENIGAWETFATTSTNQTITVTINGASATIPGIGGLARKGSNSDITQLTGLTTALSVAQGGTGGKDAKTARTNLGFTDGTVPISLGGTGATKAEDARTNLGLGSSAIKDAGTANGNVIQVGGFGIGADASLATQLASLTDGFRGGLYRMRGDGAAPATIGVPAGSGNAIIGLISIPVYSTAGFGMAFNQNNLWTGVYDPANPAAATWKKWWGETNTTVDTNGFIKRASPVIKLFADGNYETNDESEGCTVTRLSVGEYLIEGCIGLNADAAWGGIDGGFDIPTDRNKQPLIWLDYEVNPDGTVLVKIYHRTYPDAPAFARNEFEGLGDGDPIDIPRDQFVSVRVEMPADSLFNQQTSQELIIPTVSP